MHPKITIAGQDVSTYVSIPGLKVTQQLGGEVGTYDDCSFPLKKTGMPSAILAAITAGSGKLHWKEVVIEDLDMLNFVYASDNFNRTDGPLGSTNTGQAWVTPLGSCAVSSNRAHTAAATANFSYVVTPTTDVTVKARCYNQYSAVGCRMTYTSGQMNGIFLAYTSVATLVNLYECNAGTLNLLHQYTVPGNGEVLEIMAEGSTITAICSGVTLGTATSTINQGVTNHGILVTDTSSANPYEWDDFEVTFQNTRIFGGFIDAAELTLLNGPTLGWQVGAKDYKILLAESDPTSRTYSGQTDKYIIEDLLSIYLGIFFTVGSSVVASAGTIDLFNTYGESVQEAIRRICEIQGTQFYVDANKMVHYSTSFTTPAPFNFNDETGARDDTSATRQMDVLRFNEDLSGLKTKITLTGASDVANSHTETIGGSTSYPPGLDTFQLEKVPSSVTSFSLPIAPGFDGAVFWTYNDLKEPKNTPLATAESSSDWLYQLCIANNTYANQISPGPTYVIYQKTGNTGQDDYGLHKYYFEKGYKYELSYTYDATNTHANLTIKNIGAGGFANLAELTIPVQNDTFFTNGRYLWLGNGWPALINPETGLVSFTTIANTILKPNSGTPYTIIYAGSNPVKAVATYNTGRDAYGPVIDGVNHMYFNLVVKDDKVLDATSAQAKAKALLAERAFGVVTGQLRSRWASGLATGQLVPVVSNLFGINDTYQVVKIERSWQRTDMVVYTIDFGSYNPQVHDLLAKLLRQNDDSQDSADPVTTVTYTNNYSSF